MNESCLQCGNTAQVGRFCSVCGAEQQEQEAKADPLIGRVFADRYQVIELINSGGMGRVYRGVQRMLDRGVAIKCIHPHLVAEEEVAARFLDEARVASLLNHPNVVSIYDFGRVSAKDGGYPFLVMELLSGTDSEMLLQGELAKVEDVADIIEQTLAALAEAHEHGIVHRDVKPGNIMLEPRRRGGYHVKVIDFGVAKIRDNRRQTQVGIIVGTPQYMAPEQLRGESVGAEADLYAVSVVLYELLTGRLPFEGPGPAEVAIQQEEAGSLDPRDAAPDREIPEALALACAKGLTIDPKERYPDAASLAKAVIAGVRTLEHDASLFGASGSDTDHHDLVITGAPSTAKPSTREHEAVGDKKTGLLRRAPWAGELLDGSHVVWGRAGVGRSWLLARAVSVLEEGGARICSLEAPPSPLDEVGFSSLRLVIEALAGWSSSQESRKAIDEEPDIRLRDALGTIFGHSTGGTTPASVREGALAALEWAARRAVELADGGKVVLSVDDVDRFDGASLRALSDLLSEEAGVKGLSVLMSSGSALDRRLPRRVARHRLDGWTRARAIERLGGDPAAITRTDDDIEPMYVDQLGAWTREVGGEPPESLAALLEQRLRALTPAAMRTLQAIAVCGRQEIRTLANLLDHPEEVNAALLPLSDAGFIRVSAGAVSMRYDLIAQLTLAAAPTGVIASLHEKAADAVAENPARAELQAYHAIRARPGFEAFLLVEEGARLRLLRDDVDGAVDALRDGIDAARTLMMRDEDEIAKSGWLVFGRKLGAVLREANRLDEANRVLSETLNLTAPASSARAHILEQMVTVAREQNRAVEADILAGYALSLAEEAGETELLERLQSGATAPISRQPSARPARRNRDRSETRTRPSILLVEDDREVARALERWLRRQGYAGEAVYSVAEARRVKGKFACGIFDVGLPDGDGIELAEELLMRGQVGHAVFFTSSEEGSVVKRTQNVGSLVRKSKGIVALEEVVGAALRKTKSDRPSARIPR